MPHNEIYTRIMAEEVMCPGVNLLLLFLLNGHSIKLPSNSYLSTYRLVQLLGLIRNHQ